MTEYSNKSNTRYCGDTEMGGHPAGTWGFEVGFSEEAMFKLRSKGGASWIEECSRENSTCRDSGKREYVHTGGQWRAGGKSRKI